MILTCPACATQYRLKDDAIPPEGRSVRCASCKHKWHQDSGVATDPASAGDAAAVGQWPVSDAPQGGRNADALMGEAAVGGPPPPDPSRAELPLAEIPRDAAREGMIADNPEPRVEQSGDDDGRADRDEAAGHAAPDPGSTPRDEWGQPGAAYPPEQGFAAIPAMHDEDEPRRGGWMRWIVGLILLVAAAAAAFYFLAPPEWKARAGIAEAGESPLDVVLINQDRQRLASGNELVAISGRVVNLTDREQAVPPLHAELRDKTSNKLVYQWTIALSARSLAPGAAASFNSAEVDVPSGADLLSLRLAN